MCRFFVWGVSREVFSYIEKGKGLEMCVLELINWSIFHTVLRLILRCVLILIAKQSGKEILTTHRQMNLEWIVKSNPGGLDFHTLLKSVSWYKHVLRVHLNCLAKYDVTTQINMVMVLRNQKLE